MTDNSPDLLFISESKTSRQRCSQWKFILGFEGLFVVDLVGKSGGLLLFWKNSVDVTISSFSTGHICSCSERRKSVEIHRILL